MQDIVFTRTAFRLTDKLHEDYPEALSKLSNGHPYDMSTNIFDRLPDVFFDLEPKDKHEYIGILGRENGERVIKYIRKDYVNTPNNLYKFKVYMSSANGNGVFGETLTMPVVFGPSIGATETFISIGAFNSEGEAKNVITYIRTKYMRAMLNVLKTTQHLTPDVWKYVPIQNFSAESDIDWTRSLSEIDAQLYEKYDLSKDEIDFIESHVKEME